MLLAAAPWLWWCWFSRRWSCRSLQRWMTTKTTHTPNDKKHWTKSRNCDLCPFATADNWDWKSHSHSHPHPHSYPISHPQHNMKLLCIPHRPTLFCTHNGFRTPESQRSACATHTRSVTSNMHYILHTRLKDEKEASPSITYVMIASGERQHNLGAYVGYDTEKLIIIYHVQYTLYKYKALLHTFRYISFTMYIILYAVWHIISYFMAC